MRRQFLSSATASAHVTSIVAPISSRSPANSARVPEASEDDLGHRPRVSSLRRPRRRWPTNRAPAAAAPDPTFSVARMRTRRSAAQLCVARGSERRRRAKALDDKRGGGRLRRFDSPPPTVRLAGFSVLVVVLVPVHVLIFVVVVDVGAEQRGVVLAELPSPSAPLAAHASVPVVRPDPDAVDESQRGVACPLGTDGAGSIPASSAALLDGWETCIGTRVVIRPPATDRIAASRRRGRARGGCTRPPPHLRANRRLGNRRDRIVGIRSRTVRPFPFARREGKCAVSSPRRACTYRRPGLGLVEFYPVVLVLAILLVRDAEIQRSPTRPPWFVR